MTEKLYPLIHSIALCYPFRGKKFNVLKITKASLTFQEDSEFKNPSIVRNDSVHGYVTEEQFNYLDARYNKRGMDIWTKYQEDMKQLNADFKQDVENFNEFNLDKGLTIEKQLQEKLNVQSESASLEQ